MERRELPFGSAHIDQPVDIELLSELRPPVRIVSTPDTAHLDIMQQVNQLEEEYKDYYVKPVDVPYNQNMARHFPADKPISGAEHERKRNQAEASRISRDKNRFFRTRMADDVVTLTRVLEQHINRLANLESFVDRQLTAHGERPRNWTEFWQNDKITVDNDHNGMHVVSKYGNDEEEEVEEEEEEEEEAEEEHSFDDTDNEYSGDFDAHDGNSTKHEHNVTPEHAAAYNANPVDLDSSFVDNHVAAQLLQFFALNNYVGLTLRNSINANGNVTEGVAGQSSDNEATNDERQSESGNESTNDLYSSSDAQSLSDMGDGGLYETSFRYARGSPMPTNVYSQNGGIVQNSILQHNFGFQQNPDVQQFLAMQQNRMAFQQHVGLLASAGFQPNAGLGNDVNSQFQEDYMRRF